MAGLAPRKFALRTDNTLVQAAAIRAGFGIGVCQCGLASKDDDLVRVLSEEFSVSLPVWIVMHEDLRGEARCRVTFDALVEGFSAGPQVAPEHAPG